MTPPRPPRLPSFAWLGLALLLALFAGLGGCRRSSVAPGDPVAAVEGLARAVRDNDLVRYSRLSVPPDLHARLAARWKNELAAAPPPRPDQAAEYERWMARLTAPDAEAALYRDLDPKLKHFEEEIGAQWPLMRATANIFLDGVIQANDHLGPAEKAHARAVTGALMEALTPESLTDRERAKQVIAVLTRTARDLELPTLAQARALEMEPALEKGGIGLKGLKAMGKVYGLDADAALDGVEARVKSAQGDVATMQVTYPLAGKTIAFEMDLVRRDGRWYPADAVRQAEAQLAKTRPLATR
jgi:hypothetical protein